MKYLDELVKGLNLPIGVQPPSQAVIDEHVLIRFDSDQFDRQYELIVTIQYGESQLNGLIELPEGHVDLIQILCLSPICSSDADAVPTQRMVQLINKLAPIPGFGFDEVDNRLFFRHALVLNPQTCSHELLQQTFASVQQIIDLYFPMIEAVALGKVDLDKLLQESDEEFVQGFENMSKFLKDI